jgi:hypothetical protein
MVKSLISLYNNLSFKLMDERRLLLPIRTMLLLLIAFAMTCNCIKIGPPSASLLQVDSQWGFTRNIINIDTFFKQDPEAKKKKMTPEERRQQMLAEK